MIAQNGFIAFGFLGFMLITGVTTRADLEHFINPGASLISADFGFTGESGDDYSGSKVTSAGDVNGDGYDDLLISAPYNGGGGNRAGAVYLFYGDSVAAAGGGVIPCADADYTFVGEEPHDFAGQSVYSAGDVDGDGYADILIGAIGNDDGGSLAGKTYLILGSSILASGSTTIDLSKSDFSFIGEYPGDYSGQSVCSAGDVDADGYSDILIGAYANDDSGNDDAGKAYLLLGKSILASSSSSIDLSQADYSFSGENIEDYAGYSVASAGDIDADGASDILIGADSNDDSAGNAGKIYLLLGKSILAHTGTLIDLSQSDYFFTGENLDDYAGNQVASAGDIDGDGHDDALIGAPYNSDNANFAGKVYIVSGASILASASTIIPLSLADYMFVGENDNDYLGIALSGSGNVNGNGLDDVMIGAWGAGTEGKAYLLEGESIVSSDGYENISTADYIFFGEVASDMAGFSVGFAGDVNNDGLSDIMIGSIQNDEAFVSAGKSYLVLSDWNCEPADAIYVDAQEGHSGADGGEDCPVDTIQEGINLASSLGITNVIVRGGNYSETIVMSAGLSVIGDTDGGASLPVITNPDRTDYILYGADHSSIKHLRLQHGGIMLNGVDGMQIIETMIVSATNGVRCLTMNAASSNVIRNNLLIDMSTNQSACVYVEALSDGNYFINNTLHTLANNPLNFGVYLADYSGLLDPNTFWNNIIYFGKTSSINNYGFQSASTNVGVSILYNYLPSKNGVKITITKTKNVFGSNPNLVAAYPAGENYELRAGSACIDAGTPWTIKNGFNLLDSDGSRTDIGCTGGPLGFDWQ